MRNHTPERIVLPSLLFTIGLAAGCAAEITDEPGTDPAEPDFALAWEADPDLEGAPPACPPDDPACDRLDDADTAEAELLESLEALVDEAAAPAEGDGTGVFALADPQTSTGRYRIWPNGRIPYVFAKTSSGSYQLNSTTRATVSAAMTSWSSLTEGRIKFVAKTSADTAYVSIRLGSPRVRPFVGYRKGKVQELYLRQGEFLTVTKHELGHVIGFHHEQRRSDRLNHIRVRTANIVNSDTCRFQFSVCSTCKKVGSYDRVSVMHYRTSDLANCRTGSVLLNLNGTAISHVWKISTRDKNAVATMYAHNQAAMVPAGGELGTGAIAVPESGSVATEGGCLDVAGGSVGEGAAIARGACAGAASQDWRATRGGQLRAAHSLRCTAIAGDSVPGAAVEQAVCADGDPAQQWTFTGMELVHGATGDCLGATGAGIVAAACTGDAGQRFDYRADAEAIVAGGLCMTAPAAVGEPVALRGCDGSAGQRWLQARGGFVSRASLGACLGLAGGRLALAECSDDTDQRWALRGAIRDGRAGLCLDGSGAAGEPLALAACSATPAQTWTFWSR
jgi:hypothetical protein